MRILRILIRIRNLKSAIFHCRFSIFQYILGRQISLNLIFLCFMNAALVNQNNFYFRLLYSQYYLLIIRIHRQHKKTFNLGSESVSEIRIRSLKNPRNPNPQCKKSAKESGFRRFFSGSPSIVEIPWVCIFLCQHVMK